jgi:hypothetical protein
MCYTRVAAAVVALRKRVCLCAPSVTVCTVVCVRFMTGVRHAGRSTELWRFSTSTRGWGRVDSTAANGARPSGRDGHVMTSVGLDLWLHGGYSSYYSDEIFSLNVAGAVGRTWNWSDIQDFGLTAFTRIYDNDVIQVFKVFT